MCSTEKQLVADVDDTDESDNKQSHSSDRVLELNGMPTAPIVGTRFFFFFLKIKNNTRKEKQTNQKEIPEKEFFVIFPSGKDFCCLKISR